MENILIFERFRNALELHLIKNYSIKYSDNAPLILGIHGPAGEGKTFQCDKIFKELGAKVFVISPGQLESENAAQPSDNLKRKYKEASEYFMKNRKPAVIFINDLDLGIGHMTGEVQTTINTWLLVGELMHLADFPLEVDGKSTSRIPIVFTGNNFAKLYGPLLRPGRTKLFEWVPSGKEKAAIINAFFPSLSLKKCEELYDDLKSKIKREKSIFKSGIPVSFFSNLKDSVIDMYIAKFIQENGFSKSFLLALNGTHKDPSTELDYDTIYDKGIELIESGELTNHLI